MATQQQAKAHSDVLAALRRDLQAALYRCQRAERQYEAADPDNRLVAQELERRWNVALEEVHAIEARIASESECAKCATVGSMEEFANLASDLEALWNDPHADERTKKRLLRALIREIVVDIDEQTSEVVLLIHWKGGVHTPLRLPRRRRGDRRGTVPKDIVEAVRVLSRICNDEMIAGFLNRAKLSTVNGNYWTRDAVAQLRHRHQIECHSAERQESEGWMNLSDAARRMGISKDTLQRAIRRGSISAERPIFCGPWVLQKENIENEQAVRFLEQVQANKSHPTTASPLQADLDLSIT